MKHTRRAQRAAPVCLILAACLLASGLTALLLAGWHARRQLALLDGFCTALVAGAPDTAEAVYRLARQRSFAAGPGVLAALGYDAGDFAAGAGALAAAAAAGLALGGGLTVLAWTLCRRAQARQLHRLTDALETARAGGAMPLLDGGEGEAARLADEIGKTVTELTRTRQAALAARDRFAQNLANIAHQLKTPLTALSLAAQAAGGETRRRMEPQLARLTRLEESLLLLARLDSGTLQLCPAQADLFTLLAMAADNLEPLAAQRRVKLEVPEGPPVTVQADPDWTMEALLNLMKNCVEHSPPGSAVRCSYTQTPLYAEVCIRDRGPGFAPADLPRLFERFYRGAGAGPGSTGIGLAIARELLERQNALLTAGNAPDGGGQFTVRFYFA